MIILLLLVAALIWGVVPVLLFTLAACVVGAPLGALLSALGPRSGPGYAWMTPEERGASDALRARENRAYAITYLLGIPGLTLLAFVASIGLFHLGVDKDLALLITVAPQPVICLWLYRRLRGPLAGA